MGEVWYSGMVRTYDKMFENEFVKRVYQSKVEENCVIRKPLLKWINRMN